MKKSEKLVAVAAGFAAIALVGFAMHVCMYYKIINDDVAHYLFMTAMMIGIPGFAITAFLSVERTVPKNSSQK